MKDRLYKILSIMLVCCLLLFSFHFQYVKAYADVGVLSAVAAGAYSVMVGSGSILEWTGSAVAGQSMENAISDFLQSEQGGISVAEYFGTGNIVKYASGILIGKQAYDGIKSFINWFNGKAGTGYITDGIDNTFSYSNNIMIDNVYYEALGMVPVSETASQAKYGITRNGQTTYASGGSWGNYRNPSNDGITVTYNEPYITAYGYYSYNEGTSRVTQRIVIDNFIYQGDMASVTFNSSSYVPAAVNTGQQWYGDVGAPADTNLDQLIQQVYDDIENNSLLVDAEVIEVEPQPTPSPAPTPVVDIIDGINTQIGQLDGIGNDIGNIADDLDDLGNIADQQTGILGDIYDGVNDIPGAISQQSGILSGAIDQAVSDIADSIDSTTEAVESLEGSLTDALEIPTAQEATEFKFDLSTLFPFCIPFDIARMLQAFDGVAAAPHFQIPININSIGFNYTMDLDFSIFNSVAVILRQVELIAFGVALAFATSKVIRW